MDHPAFILKSHSAYVHSLLVAYLSKNCQHAFLPEIAVRYIMYNRNACAQVCWKYNTADKKQSRRFLKGVEVKFVTHLVREPIRERCLARFAVHKQRTGD